MEDPSKITQRVPASWLPLLFLCSPLPAQSHQFSSSGKAYDRSRWTSGIFQIWGLSVSLCPLRTHVVSLPMGSEGQLVFQHDEGQPSIVIGIYDPLS